MSISTFIPIDIGNHNDFVARFDIDESHMLIMATGFAFQLMAYLVRSIWAIKFGILVNGIIVLKEY